MKKLLSTTVAAVIALTSVFTLSNSVFAAGDNTAFSWYVKRNSTNTLPAAEKQFDFLEDYDAFYGDKTAAEKGDKVIYLTFDAGYENGNIEKILNTLKKHKATGAFFVLENLVKRNTDLVIRMHEEGHLVCNHTKSHPDMTKLTDKAKFDLQLSSLSDLIKEKCGFECAKFYRPPEGKFSKQNLAFAKELGYKTVFWSFAYADWDNNRQPSASDAIKKILDNVHPGEIMLLHPTSGTNAEILDSVLTTLENQGYRFGSLNEINI